MLPEAKPVVRLTAGQVITEPFLHLVGNATGHSRFPDGTVVRTSRIVAFHPESTIVETYNTRYAVDRPLFQAALLRVVEALEDK